MWKSTAFFVLFCNFKMNVKMAKFDPRHAHSICFDLLSGFTDLPMFNSCQMLAVGYFVFWPFFRKMIISSSVDNPFLFYFTILRLTKNGNKFVCFKEL